MVGAAGELECEAQPGGEAVTVPAGAPSALEVARLVDVQLHEAAEPGEPRRRVREPARVGAEPAHRRASATPSSSRRCERVGHVEPADQRARAERGVSKRAPSSSAKASTATPGTRSATAKPAATPSGPSKRPPARTLSRCEPVAHHGPSPCGTAQSEPAGSRTTRSRAAAACSRNHVSAAASSSVHARRKTPSSRDPVPLEPEQPVAQLGRT